MCIGLPMQVLGVEPGYALCEGMGETRRVDTWLIDQPAPGDWLLVFVDSAREILDPERAQQIADALQAATLALSGETNLDIWFPDLAGREPQLPDFLQPAAQQTE
jgi:hydrogenase expression/formation protein HypC